MAESGFDGDEAGEVLVFGTKSLENPEAHTWPAEGEDAGVELEESRAVIYAIPDHGADDAEVVNARGDLGKQVADRNAALTVLFELPGRFHEAPDSVFAEGEAAPERDGFAVIDGEAGLGVEGIDGGRAAVHEEEYDAFGAGGEHGRFWGEGIGNGALSGQYGAEAQQAEARSGVLKDFATGAKRHSGYSLVERLYIEVMVGE